jgi:hypothetical protein
MITKIKIEKEVNITEVLVKLNIRYGEEDITNDFPMRNCDTWTARINIDEGRIIDWPKGQSGHLYMKVSDEGSYYLYDEDGNCVKSMEDEYVPNNLIPGKYGDYIDLHITETGLISNWYSQPSFSDFLDDY